MNETNTDIVLSGLHIDGGYLVSRFGVNGVSVNVDDKCFTMGIVEIELHGLFMMMVACGSWVLPVVGMEWAEVVVLGHDGYHH